MPAQADNSETVTPTDSAMPRRSRSLELWLACAFAVVHLVAPIVIGERYPFTISPMFCDQPAECCTYRLTSADGTTLDAEKFNLHLVYDGNPPGLGMGIQYTQTLHPYCLPCQKRQVSDHVRAIMQREGIAGPITIERRHLYPKDYKIADQAERWEVSVDEVSVGEVSVGDASENERSGSNKTNNDQANGDHHAAESNLQ